MTMRKIGALTLLSLGAASLPGALMAQQSLAEYARDGQRDIVLTAITSPAVDVDEPAPDGSTALLWATYAVDHELVRALLEAGATADSPWSGRRSCRHGCSLVGRWWPGSTRLDDPGDTFGR